MPASGSPCYGSAYPKRCIGPGLRSTLAGGPAGGGRSADLTESLET